MNRKQWFIAFMSAVLGAGAILFVQWLFRVVAGQSRPNDPVALANRQQEQPGPRMRFNACRDLYGYVCSLRSKKDPTGLVKRDEAGEVQSLRIYEDIIKKNPRMPIAKIDELLVKRIYTPKKLAFIKEIFEQSKNRLLKKIDTGILPEMSDSLKETMRERIEKVKLELPPPASVYADTRDLFTRNDVYFLKKNGEPQIRIGGALLFTIQSKFNLAFTLAHELAHSIDPCELKNADEDVKEYLPLVKCLTGTEELEHACSSHGVLAETIADWIATLVVADVVDEKKDYSAIQKQSAIFNSVSDLCTYEDDKELTGPEAGFASSHPSNEKRVNDIFAKHPTIQRLLGCDISKSKQIKPVQNSGCFELLAPPAKSEEKK